MFKMNYLHNTLCIVLYVTAIIVSNNVAAEESQINVKILDEPQVCTVSADNLSLMENKYVGVIRGIAPGLGSVLPLRNDLYDSLVAGTSIEYLSDKDIRAFLSTQAGLAIKHSIIGTDEELK